MSERKVESSVIRVNGTEIRDKSTAQQVVGEIKSDTQVMKEHKDKMDRKDLKAKLITVLDRGVTRSRLDVNRELPPGVYGEWFPNDKMEIYRAESMGFKIDYEYANKRALHDGGPNGPAIVGDAIYMTCPLEVKEVIDEIRREQYEAANNPKRGKQKEERDFQAEAQQVGMPDQIKSRVDSATVENIHAALTAKD